MTLSTIERTAHKYGLTTSVASLVGGGTGMFISLERIDEYGSARPADSKAVNAMYKYLRRYNVPYEWRGYYSSLLVRENNHV